MRCALDFDENLPLAKQNLRAWSEMQSLDDEPAYKETDIKDSNSKSFMFGYKSAMDDVCKVLDNFVEDGNLARNTSAEIQTWLSSELCMQLFTILDDEPDSDE